MLRYDGALDYSWVEQTQGSTFIVEDESGDERSIASGSQIKLLGGDTMNVDFTGGAGTTADPYDLRFDVVNNSIGAAQLNVSGNGSAGQYLRTDQDGSFTWDTPPNTTYGVYTGQTADGGYLVPDRSTSTTTRYLREDGSWVIPPDTNTDTNTTYTFSATGTKPVSYTHLTLPTKRIV